MILLDTHTLIWWIGESTSLPASALKLIRHHMKSGTIAVSAMSLWEIAMLHKKGRIQLSQDLQTWADRILALPFLQWIPADPHILMKSVLLPEPFHSDPADRIIVATALTLGATIVTKDDKIRNFPHVRSVW